MQEHLGSIHDGVITGVTSFGVFVTLNDIFVEGLVHVTELGNDYFRFMQERQMLTGERTRKKLSPRRYPESACCQSGLAIAAN